MDSVVKASAEADGPAAEIRLPGTAASVPIARRLVKDALPGCPRADDLLLAISELASNAIAHSASQSGMFTVRLSTLGHWARVEVTDDGPAEGAPSHGNGWGLQIVAGVTDRSGATMEPGGRRTASAEVTWFR
jgi:two-component sensor histidine kinase